MIPAAAAGMGYSEGVKILTPCIFLHKLPAATLPARRSARQLLTINEKNAGRRGISCNEKRTAAAVLFP
jgi:hypothetical protein